MILIEQAHPANGTHDLTARKHSLGRFYVLPQAPSPLRPLPLYLMDPGDDLQAHRAHQSCDVVQETPREAKLAGRVQPLAQNQVQGHAFHLG